MSIEEFIIDAISKKKMISFDYHKHQRIVEPHVYEIKEGKKSLKEKKEMNIQSKTKKKLLEYARKFL